MILATVFCTAALIFSGCGQSSNKLSTGTIRSTEEQKSPSSYISSSSTQTSSESVLSYSKLAASVNASKLIGNNHIICIDPGHQKKVDLSMEPIAPGASVTKYKNPGGTQGVVTKLPEYALNMIVGQKLEQKLKALGYKVVMTRTNNDGNISNIGRAQIANNSGAELFIRIHADGTNSQSVKGISVQIPGNQYISNKNMLAESREIGAFLLDGLVKSTGAKSRGLVVRNDMTGFNWSKVPVVLVEMGFMSNPDEDKLMSTDSYQNKLVSGFVNGINQYFKQKNEAK